MNREIKFRAWNEPTKEMFIVEGLDLKWNQPRCLENFGENFKEDKDSTVIMQYTGAKDENDKEIYERDLVECNYCHKEYGEVYWNDDMLRYDLKWSDKDCGNARHTSIDNWSKVVGNIYQNPELLS